MSNFLPLPRFLTLEEAAQALTDRTGKVCTLRQILGCAEQHQIDVVARIGHAVKFVKVRPIEGHTNEIAVEAGSLPPLGNQAIRALLLTGEVHSRGWDELATVDVFGKLVKQWRTNFELAQGEEAPIVRPDDCRVYASQVLQLVETYKPATSETQTAPVVKAPSWNLTKPKRFQGYAKPLYVLLQTAHNAKQSRPTAREVIRRIEAPGNSTDIAQWV